MKLMTLNTHSLIEENYTQKLSDFVSAIAEIKPDIIALQEVNQTINKPSVPKEQLYGYYPCGENIIISEDNHVCNMVKLLREKGVNYYWTWLPLKCGYDKYEEGIALMSRLPITDTKVIRVSEINDYRNWKTRKIIGIKIQGMSDEWFFSVHYGWWDDKEEPFKKQWENTLSELPKSEKIWLMGDFNNPSQVRNEGYDLMLSSDFFDSFELAERKDSGITVGNVIDGWREKTASADGMRIDLILCSEKSEILSSEVIFNEKNHPVVSDHYGVLVEYERSGI